MKKLSEDMYYNYDELYSRPVITADSEIPENLLHLTYLLTLYAMCQSLCVEVYTTQLCSWYYVCVLRCTLTFFQALFWV